MPQITITFTTEQANRMTAPFREYLGLTQDPTLEDGRQAIISWVRGVVMSYERRQQIQSLPPPTPFDPT